jgi:beta-glucanase (GH16 family)
VEHLPSLSDPARLLSFAAPAEVLMRSLSRPALLATAAALLACTASCGGASDHAGPLPGWKLSWSDEFNGADGAPPDPARWTVVEGGDGWGNAEREYYTADAANVRQQGGSLLITADTAGAAGKTCWYGDCQYTSARLETRGKLDQKYGRFEARLQLPRGQGIWPAFWMMGQDRDTVGWPSCGEIDVMENVGREPRLVHGSMHGPGYSGGGALTGAFALRDQAAFAAGFHVYAVEWDADGVRFYVDETLYETRTPDDAPSGAKWVFDHPFYVLLNLAVGGAWPGDPDQSTVFPQTLEVDYVRVYAAP